MYREPAEDEHAKLDAAEIAAFQATMGAAKKVQRARVFYVLAIGVFLLGGVAAFIGLRRDESGMHRDPSCHSVYDFTVDNAGHASHREVIVCAPPKMVVLP